MGDDRSLLKKGVDLQLQTAFSDGNWPLVIRLADRRLKVGNDGYYKFLRICAESKLDSPAEKYGVVFLVDSLLKNAEVPADLESVELLEWAYPAEQFSASYSQTIGLLRLRWVKANTKNSPAVLSCLEACIQQWDLVNAQQISAVLDKASDTVNRLHMYWSITLTFLLSTNGQCPAAQRKIYTMLALKQLERAAEATVAKAGQNGEETTNLSTSERDIRSEEEFGLYYRVLAAYGSPADFAKSMRSPQLGALRHLREGRKSLFLQALSVLASQQQWPQLCELCREALKMTADGGSPSFLVADLRVWRQFIAAAGNQLDPESALAEVRDVLHPFVSAVSNATPKPAAMYGRNVGLALLDLTFAIPSMAQPSSRNGRRHLSPRLAQLGLFIERNCKQISLFDDVKSYVERLSVAEAPCFLADLVPSLVQTSDRSGRLALRVLEFKLRYFLTTCPQTRESSDGLETAHKCTVCGSVEITDQCRTCLEALLGDVNAEGHDLPDDAAFSDVITELDRDPRVDLSLVASVSLLRLAGIGLGGAGRAAVASPMFHVDVPHFLRAVLILDVQLQRTPSHIPLRLLLVKLYSLLGCASLATQLWIPQIKRCIQDGLCPLLFDRISSIAPGLAVVTWPLLEHLKSYYGPLWRKPPVKVWDAFSQGNHCSILGMAEFDDRLKRSSTRVMTLVEDRRLLRAGAGRLKELDDTPLFSDVTDDMTFVNVTDYEALPNLDSSYGQPLVKLLQLGPGFSNERSHLDLLAEQYMELVTFKPPSKDYKAAKPDEAAAAERAFVTESLAALNASIDKFLHLPDTRSKLTTAESTYYSAVSLVTAAILAGITTSRSGAVAAVFTHPMSSLKAILDNLRTSFTSAPASSLDKTWLFQAMTDQHTTFMLRETSLAIKYGASWALGFHEREMARDRTGKANLHKEVVAEMRSLEAAATKTLVEVKSRVKSLKEQLDQDGWLDQMVEWTLGGDGPGEGLVDLAGGTAAAEEWVGKVLESWRDGIGGWSTVPME